jgi:hypothetical protein
MSKSSRCHNSRSLNFFRFGTLPKTGIPIFKGESSSSGEWLLATQGQEGVWVQSGAGNVTSQLQNDTLESETLKRSAIMLSQTLRDSEDLLRVAKSRGLPQVCYLYTMN